MGRPKGSKNKAGKKKAPEIPWRFRSDPRFELGTYIIEKFLDARLKGNHYKNYVSAFKLVTKFNSKAFWASLPCKNKVKNISNFLFGDALERLKMFWSMYQTELKIHKSLKFDTKAPEYKFDKNLQTPSVELPKRKKTFLEFCR